MERRDEPKFSTLGLLLRMAPLALGLSMLDLSILDRGSTTGGGCVALDVADFQPFRIDLRALGFSFSGGGGGLVEGMAGGGVFGRGRSENRESGDGRFEGGVSCGDCDSIRRIGYGVSWSKCKRSMDALPLLDCIWAATMGIAWVDLPPWGTDHCCSSGTGSCWRG